MYFLVTFILLQSVCSFSFYLPPLFRTWAIMDLHNGSLGNVCLFTILPFAVKHILTESHKKYHHYNTTTHNHTLAYIHLVCVSSMSILFILLLSLHVATTSYSLSLLMFCLFNIPLTPFSTIHFHKLFRDVLQYFLLTFNISREC